MVYPLCASAPLHLCTDRTNAQETDSPENETLRKNTYEFISLFMQNKPNFGIDKMNISLDMTSNYENFSRWNRPKNKANSNPIKANSKPI